MDDNNDNNNHVNGNAPTAGNVARTATWLTEGIWNLIIPKKSPMEAWEEEHLRQVEKNKIIASPKGPIEAKEEERIRQIEKNRIIRLKSHFSPHLHKDDVEFLYEVDEICVEGEMKSNPLLYGLDKNDIQLIYRVEKIFQISFREAKYLCCTHESEHSWKRGYEVYDKQMHQNHGHMMDDISTGSTVYFMIHSSIPSSGVKAEYYGTVTLDGQRLIHIRIVDPRFKKFGIVLDERVATVPERIRMPTAADSERMDYVINNKFIFAVIPAGEDEVLENTVQYIINKSSFHEEMFTLATRTVVGKIILPSPHGTRKSKKKKALPQVEDGDAVLKPAAKKSKNH